MTSQRYSSLRAKLKDLGFPQYFSEESLELVEGLLRSFISLSELYQKVKKDLHQLQTVSNQTGREEQYWLKENQALQKRVDNLVTELGLQRKTTDEVYKRLELAERRYQHLSLEHSESSSLKDQRTKALIEDNNNLSATIQKFTARCLASSVPESQSLAKKINNVEIICAEMKRDKKLIEKLETAFKSLEDKQTALRDEAISLRIQLEDRDHKLTQKSMDLQKSVQDQSTLEGELTRRTSIFETK